MKKKLIAMLLMLTMCLSLFIPVNVQAAEEATAQEYLSSWAVMDLVEGDCYGIYPQSWYTELAMTKDLTPEYFATLIKGFEQKVLSIKGGNKLTKTRPSLTTDMTVSDVLKTFYVIVSNMKFNGSIGMEATNGTISFMKDAGIYTGENGEPALTEVCALEDACVYATRLVTYMYDKLQAGSKGFLWTIEKNGNKVYMLGSIHIASPDIYPFRAEIRDNFKAADYLIEEVNLFDTTGAQELAALAVYADGTTVKDHVSSEVYEKILKVADYIGVPRETIVYYKPWYLSTLFTNIIMTATESDQTVSAATGIDYYFATINYAQGKPIYEIEGMAKQAQMLDSYSDELDELLLVSSLEEVLAIAEGKTTATEESNVGNSSSDLLSMWLKNWKEGDVDAFLETYDKTGSIDETTFPGTKEELETYKKLMDEYFDKLFVSRDKGMAEYIDNLLKNGQKETFFVVVGSGHYTGETSVITLLEDMGYAVDYVE